MEVDEVVGDEVRLGKAPGIRFAGEGEGGGRVVIGLRMVEPRRRGCSRMCSGRMEVRSASVLD